MNQDHPFSRARLDAAWQAALAEAISSYEARMAKGEGFSDMNKRILFWIFLFAALLTFAFCRDVAAQDAPDATNAACPPNLVCMSREAALNAANAITERDALKAKLAATEQALTEQKALIADVTQKLAYEQGRNSALEEAAVANRAVIEAMIPMLRKKRIGLNIF